MSSARGTVAMPLAGTVICGLLAAGSVVARVKVSNDMGLTHAAERQLLDTDGADAPAPVPDAVEDVDGDDAEAPVVEEPAEAPEDDAYEAPAPEEDEEDAAAPEEDAEEPEEDAEAPEEEMPEEEMPEEETPEEDDAMMTDGGADFPVTPSGTAPPPDEAALAALVPPYIVGSDVEIAPPTPGVIDLGSGINVPTATDCAVACSALADCNAASWLGANTMFNNPSNCFLKIVAPGCVVPDNAFPLAETFLLIQSPPGCVEGSVVAGGPLAGVMAPAAAPVDGTTIGGMAPLVADAPGAALGPAGTRDALAPGAALAPAGSDDTLPPATDDTTGTTTTDTTGTTDATDTEGTPDADVVAESASASGIAAFSAIAIGAVLVF